MKLLETSYLIDFERERESARRYFHDHEHDSFTVSTISIFELAFGVVWSAHGSLQDLVASLDWAECLGYSVEDALEGARIQGELQETGQRLPITDVMIAGVARNRAATLVAGDAHFEHIEDLSVESHRA